MRASWILWILLSGGCLAEVEGGDGETGGCNGGGGGGGGESNVIDYTTPTATITADGELWLAITQIRGADNVPKLVHAGRGGNFDWRDLPIDSGHQVVDLQIETIGDRSLLVWEELDTSRAYVARLDVAGDRLSDVHELDLDVRWPELRRVGDRYLVLGPPASSDETSPVRGLWLRADGSVEAPFEMALAPTDSLAFVGDDPDGTVGEIPLAIGRGTATAYEMRVVRVDDAGEILPGVVAAASPALASGPVVELADRSVVAAYQDGSDAFTIALPPEDAQHPLVTPASAPTPISAPAIGAMVAISGGTAIGALATTGSADDRDVAPLAAYELSATGKLVTGPTPAGEGQPNGISAVATPDGFAALAEIEDSESLARFGSNASLHDAPDTFAAFSEGGCNSTGATGTGTAALLAIASAIASRRYRRRG